MIEVKDLERSAYQLCINIVEVAVPSTSVECNSTLYAGTPKVPLKLVDLLPTGLQKLLIGFGRGIQLGKSMEMLTSK